MNYGGREIKRRFGIDELFMDKNDGRISSCVLQGLIGKQGVILRY